jgi:tetratricopeptide (TPR) repeat protein
MKQDFDYSRFIERFLQGDMTPDEKIWFEKEIEGNSALKNEIDFRRQVDSVLSDKDMIELKAQLDQIHQEIYEVTEKGKGTIRKIYQRVYFAAGSLVIFALLLTMYLSNRNLSNDKLVELYYQPAKVSMNFRAGAPGQDKLAQAMQLYENKQYAKAIDLFENIVKTDASSIGVNLYSGISYMQLKQYNKANQKFQTILKNRPNPFVESATWYLGMCYILTNERNKAAIQFETLASKDGFYQNHAKSLLKHIR